MENGRIILLLCLLQIFGNSKAAEITVFDSKGVYFTIATKKLLPEEVDAARILKYYLEKQSLSKWIVETQPVLSNKKQIVIAAVDIKSLQNGSCHIYVENRSIFICAAPRYLGKAAGLFLEIFLGTRKYSDEVEYTPFVTNISIPQSYDNEIHPAFAVRLLFERSAFTSAFASWHGLYNRPGRIENDKSFGWGLWVHTMFTLLPPDKYFSSHPEFYSLRNGKRVAEQLCLSNKMVAKIVTENLRILIAAQPEIRYWSVSQMDNENYCECDECKKIIAEEIALSGPILRFVNAIAENFPDKIITTLAYRYSRKAPQLTKPLKNVSIVVCSIEANRSMPLVNVSQSDGFIYDLNKWSNICKNLMVWDYTVSMTAVPSIFPNLHTLKPNLQQFKKYGVQMVFEQGWPFKGGGLQDYKAYLLAKLMFDPNLDTDSIKYDFFNHFYGPAGVFLISIIDEMEENLIKSGLPLGLYQNLADHSDGYLSNVNLGRYNLLLGKAFTAVRNTEFYNRVDEFAQSIRLAEIESTTAKIGTKEWSNQMRAGVKQNTVSETDSLLNVFIEKTRIYGPPTMRENFVTPDEWKLGKQKKIFVIEGTNLAKNAILTFKNSYVPQFEGIGSQMLVDDIFGTDDWSITWQGWHNTDIDIVMQLKKPVYFSTFVMRFMKDVKHEILPPLKVIIYGSNNGVDFRELEVINRPPVNDALNEEIIVFNKLFSAPVKTNYLKVVAQWQGFNGSKNGSYLFSDEIFIK